MNLELWRKVFRKNRLALAGAVIVVLFLITAAFGHWIAPYDPITPDYRSMLKPPSAKHLMGTEFCDNGNGYLPGK